MLCAHTNQSGEKSRCKRVHQVLRYHRHFLTSRSKSNKLDLMEGDCILPDGLVEDILSRLAVRDLLRCRSVSKEWCALIDSPCFISKHYQVQYSIRKIKGNISHIVYNSVLKQLNFLSLQESDFITSDWTDDLECYSKKFLPWELQKWCGCVNGIICHIWGIKIMTFRKHSLGLWNPATREYKFVACPKMREVRFEVAGFGFDLSSKDLKILGTYTLLGEDKCAYQRCKIYSLTTNAWKSLRGPSSHVWLYDVGVYLNGVCYWYSMLQQVNGNRLVIVSFNFSSEGFKISDPPENAVLLTQKRNPLQTKVTLYKENIALFINHNVQEESALYRIDVWVATDFDDCGAPLSWQHMLCVGPTPAGFGALVDTTLMNGDLILRVLFCNGCPYQQLCCVCVIKPECWVYKASTTEFKKLGKTIYDYYFQYVESLFPLSKRCLL